MNRAGHEDTKFFIGPEVEHTPAYSKKTLFVVDYQDPAVVEKLARQHKVQHVFFGANHSFDTTHRTPHFDKTWNDLITHMLDRGFWVTLDYQAHQHKDVLEILSPGVWQSRLFVPLLGVRIPKVETSSPNLTVKIDDIDFKATNPGVWCRHFTELTDSNRFTDWNDYTTDEDVSSDASETVAPTVTVAVKPQEKKIEHTELSVKKVETPVQNDASIGLDPDSPSQLKDEVEETVINVVVPQSKEEVAELYTAPTEKKATKKSK